jgi:hypothetical protein
MSVLDKFATASRVRRTYTLVLDAEAQAEHDRLTLSLDDAVSADQRDGSLADPTPNLRRRVEQMEALRERMLASRVTFAIEPLPWTERVNLQSLHPPRDGQRMDQVRGYNVETFLPALIKASTVSVADAQNPDDVATDIPDDAWDSLFATLNFGGVDRLAGLALDVNDEDVRVPSSARSLIESQDSGASSESPSPGTSAPSASEAGSRRSSTRSSTAKKAAAKRAASSE